MYEAGQRATSNAIFRNILYLLGFLLLFFVLVAVVDLCVCVWGCVCLVLFFETGLQ